HGGAAVHAGRGVRPAGRGSRRALRRVPSTLPVLFRRGRAWTRRLPGPRSRARADLADELREADAVTLARSPHLGRVQRLRVWVWREYGARFAPHLAALPALREIELYQVVGGDEQTDEVDEEVRAFAARFQAKCSVPVRVVNPFDRKFPLDGRVCNG